MKKTAFYKHVQSTTNSHYFVNKDYDWRGSQAPGYVQVDRDEVLEQLENEVKAEEERQTAIEAAKQAFIDAQNDEAKAKAKADLTAAEEAVKAAAKGKDAFAESVAKQAEADAEKAKKEAARKAEIEAKKAAKAKK